MLAVARIPMWLAAWLAEVAGWLRAWLAVQLACSLCGRVAMRLTSWMVCGWLTMWLACG